MNFFFLPARREEKPLAQGRKHNKKVFLISKRKLPAYRYFFSMSNEENYSESEFFIQREILDIGLDALTSPSLCQFIKALVWDFPVMTLISIISGM